MNAVIINCLPGLRWRERHTQHTHSTHSTPQHTTAHHNTRHAHHRHTQSTRTQGHTGTRVCARITHVIRTEKRQVVGVSGGEDTCTALALPHPPRPTRRPRHQHDASPAACGHSRIAAGRRYLTAISHARLVRYFAFSSLVTSFLAPTLCGLGSICPYGSTKWVPDEATTCSPHTRHSRQLGSSPPPAPLMLAVRARRARDEGGPARRPTPQVRTNLLARRVVARHALHPKEPPALVRERRHLRMRTRMACVRACVRQQFAPARPRGTRAERESRH